jgi:Saxitoxin biosynthesis operon protein SxtJ
MQWSEIVKPPPPKLLRQFAVLWLVVFGGLAAWQAWQGNTGVWTQVLAASAVLVGALGIVWPAAIRFVYTGWMIAVFPIGWTVSRVVLAAMFYLLFTPVGLVFRWLGRDALRLKRPGAPSYWTAKPVTTNPEEYFRQS